MKLTVDKPKSLRDPEARQERLAAIGEPHVAPLTRFVESIRRDRGLGEEVPYFDPADGGIDARCLFLLEAPGPKAVASGFISRNNNDETAKNFFRLNQDAGLPREWTVSWNIVPWCIRDGDKCHTPKASEVEEGSRYLADLLMLLPGLELIVLIGRNAQRAAPIVHAAAPRAMILAMPHPSPQSLNPNPGNRVIILSTLKAARQILESLNRASSPA